MAAGIPQLVSATTTRERRVFIAVVGVLNLAFLALDATAGYPHPAAVLTGRVGISLIFFWAAWRLGRAMAPGPLRVFLAALAVVSTALFGLLAWGAGGAAGPYLAFMALLPLVVTVAIPDEPWAPIGSGLVGGGAAIAMEVARGVAPGRVALLVLAFGSSTLYGWAGTFLFRRMRVHEAEAERRRAEAHAALEEALALSRRNEALYRGMAASFPEGIMALFGADLRTVLADGSGSAFSIDASHVVGKRALDFLPPELAGRVEAAQRTALAGTPATLEFRFAERDIAMSFHPVRDASGTVILGLSIVRDVTERRALEARVATSSRLAALGTLVAGVAHEVNNPLAGAMATHGYLLESIRRMRARLDDDTPLDRPSLAAELAEAAEALEESLGAQQRISEIVKDLTLLGRPPGTGARVPVRRVVEAALRWIPPPLGQGHGVRLEVDGDPHVMGTEGQLAQVVLNLVTNALRAVPEGRAPDVHVRVGVGPPGRVHVEVEDNGAGMAPEILPRIFDPFFTTREVGQGMGLGLAICHALVTAHGGNIVARSDPGAGTTMRVELPEAPPLA